MTSREIQKRDHHQEQYLSWLGLNPAKLTKDEIFWRDHQQWLESCGYMLRPRYKPDWKPSWIDGDLPKEDCEDFLPAVVSPTSCVYRYF